MEISISFSPILDLPFFLSFFHFLLVYWCTGGGVLLSNFQVPTFQLFKHQVFFPSRGFLAALFLCSKPVLWFNARRSSIFIFFRRRVLVRNGGKGCLHRSRGGDETRRTQHARVVEHERRRRSQTGQSESGDGGRSRNTHRPHQETHSLTHSLLVWGMETTPLRLRF